MDFRFTFFDNYPRWELLPAISVGRSVFGISSFVQFKFLRWVFEICWGPEVDAYEEEYPEGKQ